MEVPAGFGFRPTHEEMMKFLKNKAEGREIGSPFVIEKNLYSNEEGEPWDLLSGIDKACWSLYDESSRKRKAVYVITKLSKKVSGKTSRTAGHGTWDGQTKKYPLLNDNQDKIIGYGKMLTFAIHPDYENLASGRGYWYLQEMTISDESLSTDYVMCQIIRDTSKPCQVNGKIRRGKKFKKKSLVGAGSDLGAQVIGNYGPRNYQDGSCTEQQIFGGSTETLGKIYDEPECYIPPQVFGGNVIAGSFSSPETLGQIYGEPERYLPQQIGSCSPETLGQRTDPGELNPPFNTLSEFFEDGPFPDEAQGDEAGMARMMEAFEGCLKSSTEDFGEQLESTCLLCL